MRHKIPPKIVERQFPPLYEKWIPGMIAVLSILMVAMLIFTISIAMGWFAF